MTTASVAPAASPPSPFSVFKRRDFTLIWTGQLVSTIVIPDNPGFLHPGLSHHRVCTECRLDADGYRSSQPIGGAGGWGIR